MGTRSNIAIKRKNNSVDVIYCHWDGYLSWNGRILLEHYKDVEKINELISLGDISSLRKNVSPVSGEHTFDNPQEDVVVAYGRDRGETNVETRHFKSLEEYLDNVDTLFIEYIYIYDEKTNKWYYISETYKYYNSNEKISMEDIKELTKEIIEEEK